MRLYVDLESQKIVVGPGQAQERADLRFVRAPSATVEVQFIRDGVVQELAADATGTMEFKTTGKFDQDPALTGALAWIKSGTGTATFYTFVIPFVTTGLDAAFKVDGDDTNDVDDLELMTGIQWIEGGNVNETFKLKAIVFNDVVREGDTVPEMPPFAFAVFPAGITSIANLKALPTTNALLGYIIQIRIVVSGQLSWLTYSLEAGPAVNPEPADVEPDDYDAGTNDKHWEGAVGPSGPSGRDAGFSYNWNTNTATTDPTSGKIKVNAAPGSATEVYVSETSAESVALATLIASWGTGTSAAKGTLVIEDPATPANYLQLRILSAVSDQGAWDKFTVSVIASGGTLTNGLGVKVAFYPSGDKGDTGATGAGFAATSATSFTPGTGSKAFTTQAGLAYSAGARVRAASAAGPTTTWMEGVVTAYGGTTLTVTIDKFLGSGAHTDWNLNSAGEPGATGATGASYAATSVTSFTPGTGSKAFATQAGLAYVAGLRVRIASAAGVTTTWMEGIVTAYSGTTLTVTIDSFLGSGAHTDWNIGLIGQIGGTGATGGTTYDAPVAIPTGPTPTVDLTATSMSPQRLLAANTAITFSNPVASKVTILHIKQAAASSFTVSFTNVDVWEGTGGGPPVMSAGFDVVDVYTFWYDGTFIYGTWAGGA